MNERTFARSWRNCSNVPGCSHNELGLLLQRVLRRLQPPDDHRVDDPGDLQVGELAVQRLVVNLAQVTDHVVLRVSALRSHMLVDVVLEAVEASEHAVGLLRAQLVLEPAAVDERRDDGISPLRQLWDVSEREPEDTGHHALGERSSETADELHGTVVDPLVEQVVRMLGDHVPMTQGAGPDPRVGELPAVADVELLRRTQRHHRRRHQVVRCRIGLLGRQAVGGVGADPRLRQAREPLGILHDTGDVIVLREHVRIGPGLQATTRDAQHRRLAVQDLVRLVPVLLRAFAEQVHGVEIHGTRHRAELVVDVLRIRRHARVSPPSNGSRLSLQV